MYLELRTLFHQYLGGILMFLLLQRHLGHSLLLQNLELRRLLHGPLRIILSTVFDMLLGILVPVVLFREPSDL